MKKIFLMSYLSLAMTIASVAQNENYKAEIAAGYKGSVINDLKTLDKSLGFCVIGDWGRYGSVHQKAVAEQLGSAMVGIDGSFILSTGDNFYPNGVASEFDPIFKYSFEDVYTSFPTHNDWYVSLGNHDYRTNPDAEVAYTKISARWKMPSRYFNFKKRIDKDTAQYVEFFVIDTTPFQKDYYTNEGYAAHVKGVDTLAQKKWLESKLKNSKATWKIVVGHHPLYSAGGRKGKTQDMEKAFKNIFEKYKIDAYLCGHEHHLEYDAPSDVHFVQFISGSGSEATAVTDAPFAKFVKQDYGILAVNVTAKEMLFQFVNAEGKVLYTTSLQKK